MKRIILFLFLALFFFEPVFAQVSIQHESINKEGTKWTYVYKDAKGTITSYEEQIFYKRVGNNSKFYIINETRNYNSKKELEDPDTLGIIRDTIFFENGKPVFTQEMTKKMIKETIRTMNDDELKITSKGDFFAPRPDMKVGDKFSPLTITARMDNMNFVYTMSDITIRTQETLFLADREFDCLVVFKKTNFKVSIFINETRYNEDWYCPGYEIIKSISYDKRKKIDSIMELVSIEKL